MTTALDVRTTKAGCKPALRHSVALRPEKIHRRSRPLGRRFFASICEWIWAVVYGLIRAVNEFFTVLAAVMPVFGIMAIGVLLRQRGWLALSAEPSLLRVCVNLLLPALIFDSVLGNAALRRPENLLLPPLVGFGMAAVGYGLSLLAGRLADLAPGTQTRSFGFTAGLQNYGYLAIPLSVMLFDPATTGVLFIHNVGAELSLWTLGLAVLTGEGFTGGWRKVINAPLVALFLAVILNALGAWVTPPEPVFYCGRMLVTAMHLLGQCAIPLALLLIGGVVADHLAEIRSPDMGRVIVTAVVVRLGVMPALFLLLARYLPCSWELKQVIILQGAMTAAVLPIALTRHYRGDTRTALQVGLGTSVAGLITVPLWIRLGLYLVKPG
jgi:predicted permease